MIVFNKTPMLTDAVMHYCPGCTHGIIHRLVAEVIEELIRMANELRQMRTEEDNLGLTEDEIAFYDALTDDETVKELMNDEILVKIAQELTQAIRSNVTIDFNVRKSSQAGMRRIVKRLLKKYDYPPESAKKALETVMRQTELMCENEAYRIATSRENHKGMVAEESSSYLN